jgi:hypothetical protein
MILGGRKVGLVRAAWRLAGCSVPVTRHTVLTTVTIEESIPAILLVGGMLEVVGGMHHGVGVAT